MTVTGALTTCSVVFLTESQLSLCCHHLPPSVAHKPIRDQYGPYCRQQLKLRSSHVGVQVLAFLGLCMPPGSWSMCSGLGCEWEASGFRFRIQVKVGGPRLSMRAHP